MQPIFCDDFPEDVISMILEAEEFSVDRWRDLTSQWPIQTKRFAILCRSQGQTSRAETRAKGGRGLEDLFPGGEASKDDGVNAWMAIFCLSDATLDRLLEAIDYEEIVADLSPEMQAKIRSEMARSR